MTPIRILVVDDHSITRDGLGRLLESEPDLVVIGEAGDGQTAVRLAQELRPDILLLDIKLPRLDGIQVARILRDMLPDMKIVVLTGYDEPQYPPAMQRLGVQGYLSKSVSTAELTSVMRRVYAGEVCFPSLAPPEPATGGLAGPTLGPTAREMEVLLLVEQGVRNREIAEALKTSERTVQFHLTNLFAKLRVASRTELCHAARLRGWLPAPAAGGPLPVPLPAGDQPAVIDLFEGRYAFLSNAWPVRIAFDGQAYPSVDHAFQAAQTLDEDWRQRVRRAETPWLARRLARRLPVRPDWTEAMSLTVMEDLLRQKFRDPTLHQELLATGEARLIEGNTWQDTFWGVCNGVGQNHLGRLLMRIRDEARAGRLGGSAPDLSAGSYT